jgi:hypothetical protein
MSSGNEREAMRRLVASVPEGDVRIVIGHQPDYVIPLHEWTRVDLALAGHTHGGQVALPFFGPPYGQQPAASEVRGRPPRLPGHAAARLAWNRPWSAGPAPQLRSSVRPRSACWICVSDQRVAGPCS